MAFDINRERQLARNAYTSGQLALAISKQRALISEQASAYNEVLVSDYRQLAFFLIAANRNDEAAATLLPVIETHPDNADLLGIIGLVYTNLKQHDRAITFLKRALTADAQNFMAADQLTRCYLAKREVGKAKQFGELSLKIKDEIYSSSSHALETSLEAKLPSAKGGRNVIAFSLWGNNPRYLSGALRNVEMAEILYPDWQCRFYTNDTVPEHILRKLGARGVDVRKMTIAKRPFDGLFWRFHAVSDTKIDRFLIRDCDSVINVKERVAVDEWLASGKHFHVMRDYYTHTDLVMAGMWGGVTGVIKNVEKVISDYVESHIQSRVMDQSFLNECLWSTIKESVLVHDSCFETKYSSSFPPYCHLPPGRHIGQDEFTYLKAQAALAVAS